MKNKKTHSILSRIAALVMAILFVLTSLPSMVFATESTTLSSTDSVVESVDESTGEESDSLTISGNDTVSTPEQTTEEQGVSTEQPAATSTEEGTATATTYKLTYDAGLLADKYLSYTTESAAINTYKSAHFSEWQGKEIKTSTGTKTVETTSDVPVFMLPADVNNVTTDSSTTVEINAADLSYPGYVFLGWTELKNDKNSSSDDYDQLIEKLSNDITDAEAAAATKAGKKVVKKVSEKKDEETVVDSLTDAERQEILNSLYRYNQRDEATGKKKTSYKDQYKIDPSANTKNVTVGADGIVTATLTAVFVPATSSDSSSTTTAATDSTKAEESTASSVVESTSTSDSVAASTAESDTSSVTVDESGTVSATTESDAEEETSSKHTFKLIYSAGVLSDNFVSMPKTEVKTSDKDSVEFDIQKDLSYEGYEFLGWTDKTGTDLDDLLKSVDAASTDDELKSIQKSLYKYNERFFLGLFKKTNFEDKVELSTDPESSEYAVVDEDGNVSATLTAVWKANTAESVSESASESVSESVSESAAESVSTDAESTTDSESTTESNEEISYPAFTDSIDVDDSLSLTITVDEGTLPEGTTVEATAVTADTQVSSSDVADAITKKLSEGSSLSGFVAYDITFYDENGEIIEPKDSKAVKVSLNWADGVEVPGSEDDDEETSESLAVYHLALNDDRTAITGVTELSTKEINANAVSAVSSNTGVRRAPAKQSVSSVDQNDINSATLTIDGEKVNTLELTLDEFSIISLAKVKAPRKMPSSGNTTIYFLADATAQNVGNTYWVRAYNTGNSNSTNVKMTATEYSINGSTIYSASVNTSTYNRFFFAITSNDTFSETNRTLTIYWDNQYYYTASDYNASGDSWANRYAGATDGSYDVFMYSSNTWNISNSGTTYTWHQVGKTTYAPYTAVTDIKLSYAGQSEGNAKVLKGGNTFMISSDITPSNATNQTLVWHITDTEGNTSDLVTITQTGVVTSGDTEGTVKIYATIDDTNPTTGVTTTITSNTITMDIVDKIDTTGITITPASATIKVGRTQTLTVTATPEGASNAVTWESNNTSVATVSNGVVTGVSAGTATITATSTATAEGSAAVTATATITVTDKTTVYLRTPTSWGTEAYVYFYNSDTDRYTTAPTVAMTKLDNQYYQYDSADISDSYYLFSVEVPEKNGQLYNYAIFAQQNEWKSDSSGQWPDKDHGGAVVRLTGTANAFQTDDTSTSYPTASHTVTLKTLNSITVTPASSTISTDKTVQLKATANYAGDITRDVTGAGVVWTSSNDEVATVSSAGLVTPLKEGEVTITATSETDSTKYGTASVKIEDATPTGISISNTSVIIGTTATLTPTFTPENVNTSKVRLKWESSSPSVATVDEDGVVTGVAAGTTTITVTVLNEDGTESTVKGTATITVTGSGNRLYFYSAISKLSYAGTYADNGTATRGMPDSTGTNGKLYAYVWNNNTDGTFKQMTKLGLTTANGRTYADGDIYYVDGVIGSYTHVIFLTNDSFTGYDTNNAYGRRTGDLDLPTSGTYKNPCFYAGSGDDCIYTANGTRPGYWAEAFTVYDPEKVSGHDSSIVNVHTGSKPTTDSHQSNKDITYVSSTLYDYYSDYELNGKQVKNNTNNWAQDSQRNWVTFRQFDQAVSDYYKSASTSTSDVIYTGHFQPDNLNGNKFSSIQSTLNLYGYNGDNNGSFFVINNSNNAYGSGTGQYSNAAQGLVSNSLSGFSNGTLGTGTLYMEDGSTSLPHFNESFLTGNNSKNAILGQVWHDVQFPFVQEADPYYTGVNYYTYDSARMPVYLRNDSGTLYLEDVGNSGTEADKSKNVNSGSATSGVSSTYGYFPFNEDSTSGNAKTYDYGYGTKLEFTFSLGDNGDVTASSGNHLTSGKAPTIFKFSGDDDVWVFIDGKLVLDLGGSHGQVQGAINFSTDLDGYAQFPSQIQGSTKTLNVSKQSVSVSGTKADGLSNNSIDISDLNLWDGNDHVLTLYYMERGMWESNMMVQFNMSVRNTINVQKNWENYDGSELSDSRKKTVYAVIKRSYPQNTTEQFYNATGSSATDGSQYLVTLNSSNSWKQTFNVDEYVSGHENDSSYKYTYYVYEVQVDSSGNPQYEGSGTSRVPKLYNVGATMIYGNDTFTVVDAGGAITGSTGTIVNRRQAGSTVSITKEWEGIADSALPSNVYVKLYSYTTASQEAKDATAVTKDGLSNETDKAKMNDSNVIALNADNNWSASFEDLDTTKTYFFKEVTDASGTTEKNTGDTIEITGADAQSYSFTISSRTVGNAQIITNTIANADFKLTKVSSSNTNTKLGGVQFELYKDDGTGNAGSGSALTFTGSEGAYTLSTTGESRSATLTTKTDDGTLEVKGLAPGIYWLKETKSADGYNTLSADVKIDLTSNHTASYSGTNGSILTSPAQSWSNNTLTFTLSNTPGAALPYTGGTGTTLLTMLGTLLAVAAALGFMVKKKVY